MAIFWTQKQDIGPSPRTAHGFAYDQLHDRVVVFGGDPGGAPLADTWAWDGGLWTQVADTGPSARHDSAMAYEPQTQRVVLFGGASGPNLLSDTWAWDGAEWTQVADTGPSARAGHAVAYDQAMTRVVLFGGSSGGGPLGDTWVWDGNEWTEVQDVGPSARRGHGMAYDQATQHVVLFGGAGASGAGQGDTWAWDGSNWAQVADTGPDARVAAALAADGGVVLFGGINSIDPALAPANRVMFGDTWRWLADGWTKVQDIGPSPRWGHGLAYRTQVGKAMVFGGASAFAASEDSNLAPRLDTWELPLAASQPGGGQPGGQPIVGVASVTVQPNAISSMAMGMPLDVGVQLTALLAANTGLDVVIAVDQGGGNWGPSSPPGFDFQTPQMLAGGSMGTQFVITRNADPIPLGDYAVAASIEGAGMWQIGQFTVGP